MKAACKIFKIVNASVKFKSVFKVFFLNELYPTTRGETRSLSNAYDVTTVVLVSLLLDMFCFCF